MSKYPLVSVIIPTYNRAELLKSAVDSVLVQDYKNIELIIIDDGSTDNTGIIIKSIDNPKIKYIYQKNQGRSNARNNALRVAKGKYIAFLDSDDIFLPMKISKQVEILENNKQYKMVYTSARPFDENGQELFPTYIARDSGWIYNKIAFYVPLTVILPTVMVDKSVFSKVGLFDEKMNRFEDTDMWRRISKSYQIYALSEPFAHIYSHSDNKMEDPEKLLGSIDYYVEKILSEDKDRSMFFKRRGASSLYLHYANAVDSYPKYKNYSIKYFLKSLQYWPYRPRLLFNIFKYNLRKSKKIYSLWQKIKKNKQKK